MSKGIETRNSLEQPIRYEWIETDVDGPVCYCFCCCCCRWKHILNKGISRTDLISCIWTWIYLQPIMSSLLCTYLYLRSRSSAFFKCFSVKCRFNEFLKRSALETKPRCSRVLSTSPCGNFVRLDWRSITWFSYREKGSGFRHNVWWAPMENSLGLWGCLSDALRSKKWVAIVTKCFILVFLTRKKFINKRNNPRSSI